MAFEIHAQFVEGLGKFFHMESEFQIDLEGDIRQKLLYNNSTCNSHIFSAISWSELHHRVQKFMDCSSLDMCENPKTFKEIAVHLH